MKELSVIAWQLGAGIGNTLALFAVTLILSLPLGLLLALARTGKNAPLRAAMGGYVCFMRGTPLLLQLFFIYYGLPFFPGLEGIMVPGRFAASCVAFVLNYAAYFCEIFRGGLLAVDPGQYDAAHMLGFSRAQALCHIILPQVARVTLPAVAGECLTLVKDTALATAIGVTELLYFAKAAVNRTASFAAYPVAAAYYLAFSTLLSRLFARLERRFAC